jgi:hypothetical protein
MLDMRIGPQVIADGGLTYLRGDTTGALVATSAHGKYSEPVMRGNCYMAAVKSATVTATTDISPIPATTGRALLGVFNPALSGKNLMVLKIGVSTVSGTPGGPFYLDYIAAPSGIVAGIGQAPTNLLTLLAAGSVARALAATVPAQTVVGVMLRPLGGLAAAAVGAGVNSIDEDIAGLICVPPGAALVITAHATGTSQVISGYMAWEEVTVL